MQTLCMGCMKPYEETLKKCPHCGYSPGTLQDNASHLQTGNILKERFMVGRVLGFDEFSVNYIGYDLTLNVRVTIKEYFPGEFGTRMPNQNRMTIYSGEKGKQYELGKKKFLDEAQKLAQFEDIPEVIHVIDCFEENRTAYIIMEYLEGESLEARLERIHKMPVEVAFPIIIDILHALRAVHSIGLLHRSIAPENIFLYKNVQGNEGVKLVNFGAARFATSIESRSLTVLVKQGYAPVEQYHSNGVQGSWTDVYAVAATFYRMITGIVPEDAMERLVKDTLPVPSKLGVKIGPNTESAIMNALNVRGEERTQTAEEFEKELMANVVVRHIPQKQKVDIGKWPLWVKVIAGSVVISLFVFAIMLRTGVIDFQEKHAEEIVISAEEEYVPSVINQDWDDAKQLAEEKGFLLVIADKQYSNDILEGKILEQSVEPGSLIKTGNTIEVILSAGVRKTEVPYVLGMESEKAIELLQGADLKIETGEEEGYSAKGTIAEQSIEPYTQTDTGTTVRLVISKGHPGADPSKTEIVEDMTGILFDDALKEQSKHYIYLITERAENSREVPKGAIISQSVMPGETVHQDSNIRVVVSLGPKLIRIPDVELKTEAEARDLLAKAGIEEIVIHTVDRQDIAKGNVVTQSIAKDTEVEEGSVIELTISTGNKPKSTNTGNSGGSGKGNNGSSGSGQNGNNTQGHIGIQPPLPTAAPPAQTAAPPPQTAAPSPQTQPAYNPAFDLFNP